MTYLVLSAVALGIAVAVAVAAVLIKRPARLGSAIIAAAVTALVLVVLTAIFDSLMIAAGLMEYTAAHLIGWFIGLAPIEDFAYPIAAVILLPALWLLAAPRPRYRRTAGADHAH